jgi:hypothetical protein
LTGTRYKGPVRSMALGTACFVARIYHPLHNFGLRSCACWLRIVVERRSHTKVITTQTGRPVYIF